MTLKFLNCWCMFDILLQKSQYDITSIKCILNMILSLCSWILTQTSSIISASGTAHLSKNLVFCPERRPASCFIQRCAPDAHSHRLTLSISSLVTSDIEDFNCWSLLLGRADIRYNWVSQYLLSHPIFFQILDIDLLCDSSPERN